VQRKLHRGRSFAELVEDSWVRFWRVLGGVQWPIQVAEVLMEGKKDRWLLGKFCLAYHVLELSGEEI
jgi:hypothetical protein